jgi:hypothetical protein
MKPITSKTLFNLLLPHPPKAKVKASSSAFVYAPSNSSLVASMHFSHSSFGVFQVNQATLAGPGSCLFRHLPVIHKWPYLVGYVLLNQVSCVNEGTNIIEGLLACFGVIPKRSSRPSEAKARPDRVLDNPLLCLPSQSDYS